MRELSQILIFVIATTIALPTSLAGNQQTRSLRHIKPISNDNQHSNIETRELEPGLFHVSYTPPIGNNNSQGRRLRVDQQLDSCLLYLEDIYYEAEDAKNVEEKWVCRFENYVIRDGGIPFPYTFYLAGDAVENDQFQEAGVISGEYRLRWDSPEAVTIDESDNTITLNAEISEDQNVLWIERMEVTEQAGRGKITNDEETNLRKLHFLSNTEGQIGPKKTLVIRIVGDGVGPEASLVQIRDEVFGSDITLKSQMEKCSHGKLTIQPFSGQTQGQFFQHIVGGVVELGITTNPYGRNDKQMENDVMEAAWYVFGDLYSQFDLVLFVLPPGIVPSFAAYAYIGTPFSFFSNNKIEDAMVQMHEIGHNLGLQHSGKGEEEYGDTSGYMGYTEKKDVQMCYNAVNNFQLGWYSSLSINLSSADNSGGTYFISGVAGYDPNDTTKYVTLRLVQKNMAGDYYIGYNRAEGMNAETQEDGNKVIVFIKDGAVHESKFSWKKATLHVGESYVIENFDNSGRFVKVTFSKIESYAAVVEIIPERTESPTSPPRPTISPTISRPLVTPSPTASPSASQTGSQNHDLSNLQSPSSAPTTSSTGTTTFMTSTEAPTVTLAPTDSGMPSGLPSESLSPTTNSTVSAPVCDDDVSLSIEIRTDKFPYETWWKLKLLGGENIFGIDPSTYKKEETNYTHSFCLDYESCYLFKIFDTAGDGMREPGYYRGFIDSEQIFGKEGGWGNKKIHKFCTPSLGNETEEELFLGNETDIDTDAFSDYFDFYANETSSKVYIDYSDLYGKETNSTP